MQQTDNLGFLDRLEKKIVACEKHGKVVVSVFKTTPKNKIVCPICETLAEKERDRIERQERRIAYALKKGIKKRHVNATFAAFIPPSESAKNAVSLLEALVKDRSTKNVLLYGNTGAGKTMLCCAAILDRGGMYTTWEDLDLSIRSSYSKGSRNTEAQILSGLCAESFLVIDEVDKGKNTESKRHILSYIFRTRYEDALPTWLSGNCNAQWVNKMLDTSVIRRLKENGVSILFDWGAYTDKKHNKGWGHE